jgi:hypothetical protein
MTLMTRAKTKDGEELTPAVDAAILRTLARIKKRPDPEIYESGKDIFEGRKRVQWRESLDHLSIRAPCRLLRRGRERKHPNQRHSENS